MSWNEQTTSRSTERSIDGYWHLTRLFRVNGFARANILSNLPNILKYDGNPPAGEIDTGLPEIGVRGPNGTTGGDVIELQPGGVNTKVYAYNAVTIPTDVPLYTDVEIRYTNDPRLINQTIEEQLTFQSADMSLPIGQRSTRAAQGGTPQFAWMLHSETFPYKVGRFSQIVLLRDWEVTLAKRPIFEQTNWIHWLPILPGVGDSGRLLMKFMGADIVRYSPSYFTCRYSWEYDGGHLGPLILSLQQGSTASQEVTLPPKNIPFGPFFPTDPANQFVRPPYHRLRGVILAGSGTRTPPVFYAVRSDLINPEGYTELIGVDL